MGTLGVYPVFGNTFKVAVNGVSSESPEDMKTVANITSFTPAFEGTTQEWSSLESMGWNQTLITGKKLSIALSGKRTYGDAGNDYVASLAFETGEKTKTVFIWELSNGATLKGNVSIDVTSIAGGESTDLDLLEFTVLFDGKPAFTPAPEGGNV